jgi:hypothetical protein
MSVLTPDVNDFIGEINLDLSNDSNVVAQFESMGTTWQKDILRDLLDDELYNLLIADLDGNGDPQTTKYIELVDGKTYERPSGKEKIYEGLIRMLNYYVYDLYLNFTWSSNVSTGQITNVNENSTKVNRADLKKVRADIQNKAVNLYNSAVTYLNDENETYFTGANSYSFWDPKVKKYDNKITMGTPSNPYFYNRSSERN